MFDEERNVYLKNVIWEADKFLRGRSLRDLWELSKRRKRCFKDEITLVAQKYLIRAQD